MAVPEMGACDTPAPAARNGRGYLAFQPGRPIACDILRRSPRRHTPRRHLDGPTTYEWSLQFGDAVHNYRSALDALAWEMAHLDGNSPDTGDERHIYFPIKRSAAAFDKDARTRLKSVPQFVLDRMERLQPYHVAPGQQIDDGIGLILSDLDNQDKHRAAVEMRAIAADRTHYSLTYRPRNPEINDDGTTEWIAPDRPIADGDPIVRWTFQHPVDHAQIETLPMRITVEHNGTRHDAFEILRLIEQQVAATFEMVDTGDIQQ